MRFSAVSSLLSLLPLTLGLQTIYLGRYENSAEDVYIAWFSDLPNLDVCDKSTIVGNYGRDSPCGPELTLQGHPNITFTGCSPCDVNSVPTGVSDDGAKALKCEPGTNPKGGFPCAANGGVGVIDVISYCS